MPHLSALAALARWPALPTLQQRSCLRKHCASVALAVYEVRPEAALALSVCTHYRNHLRGIQEAAHHVVQGSASHGYEQEGDERTSNPSHAWNRLVSDRLVYVHASARRNERP